MSNNLIDQSLRFSMVQSVPVRVSLRTGETVSLRVKDFDGYVVLAVGEPDYLLYRHSILDVDGGAGHRPVRRNAERKAGPRPKPSGKPQKSQGRAQRKSGSGPKTAPKTAPQGNEDRSFANPMADQMKKWLDSQKESE